ncbi:Glutaredoxin domain-containing protein [Psidium guajava]|nr:Glutaredoxin domain-containing protein [Psidium guajava]
MGCVSSNLLSHDDEFSPLGTSALGHHIVSLTSTTYGLLTLDPPTPSAAAAAAATPTTPPTPPPRFTLGSIFPSPLSDPKSFRSESKPLWSDPTRPEIINSWELMSGLDAESFRFSPLPQLKFKDPLGFDKENSNPNNSASRVNSFKFQIHPSPGLKLPTTPRDGSHSEVPSLSAAVLAANPALNRFEDLCPPRGEDRVVIYTTTLRGVRKTFEDCNAVRAALEGLGVAVCERDVSMDSGFKEELRELMKGRARAEVVPPRVFVRGRYLGGAEEVMRIVEEGGLGELLEGLPKRKAGMLCEGCGGVRFLPCFRCNGSCKVLVNLVMVNEEGEDGEKPGRVVVVRCSDCNENGLVLCPICS